MVVDIGIRSFRGITLSVERRMDLSKFDTEGDTSETSESNIHDHATSSSPISVKVEALTGSHNLPTLNRHTKLAPPLLGESNKLPDQRKSQALASHQRPLKVDSNLEIPVFMKTLLSPNQTNTHNSHKPAQSWAGSATIFQQGPLKRDVDYHTHNHTSPESSTLENPTSLKITKNTQDVSQKNNPEIPYKDLININFSRKRKTTPANTHEIITKILTKKDHPLKQSRSNLVSNRHSTHGAIDLSNDEAPRVTCFIY